MTGLDRKVRRVTNHVDYRTGRPLMIELEQGGKLVRIRAKGAKTAYSVTYQQIWVLGAQNAAVVLRAAKKARLAERKKLREGK